MLQQIFVAMRLPAIGMLLAVMLVSGCSSISTHTTYQQPRSALGVIINLAKHDFYSIDDDAMQEYQVCVTTSLKYSMFGDKCSWDTPKVRGIVAVADVYQTGSQTCKVLRSSFLDTNKKTFARTELACGEGNNWKFIRS